MDDGRRLEAMALGCWHSQRELNSSLELGIRKVWSFSQNMGHDYGRSRVLTCRIGVIFSNHRVTLRVCGMDYYHDYHSSTNTKTCLSLYNEEILKQLRPWPSATIWSVCTQTQMHWTRKTFDALHRKNTVVLCLEWPRIFSCHSPTPIGLLQILPRMKINAFFLSRRECFEY